MTQLEDLQARRQKKERDFSLTKVRLDQETQRLREAVMELKSDFGVSSIDAANQLLAQLKQDFEAELAAADEALRAAGA